MLSFYSEHCVAFEARNGCGSPFIVFSDVLLNPGNGFNSSTGIFTAPYPGQHLCAAKICHSKSYNCQFLKNGVTVVTKKVTTYNTEVIWRSLTYVTYLETGDHLYVYVILERSYNFVPTHVENEFIGYRLQ